MAVYVKITGQKQGVLTGDVSAKGYEKQIAADNIGFSFARPSDNHSGQATGGVVARPLVMNKTADQSTPLLMNACLMNEVLPQILITFVTASSGTVSGITPKALLKIENAVITGYDHHCNADSVFGSETVTFSYQKAEYTWVDSSTVSSYDFSMKS